MSNVPWSVKGVEPEAREAAKLAARKAGLPLGLWLSQTIHAAAAQQLKSSSGPTMHTSSSYSGASFGAQPHAGAAPGGQMPPGGAKPPALTPEAVLESINRLANKIDQSEARTAEALAPIVEKVAKLSAQVEASKNSDSRMEIDPLERALLRMSERLDNMEQGGRGRRPAPPSDDRPSSGGPRRSGLFSRLFSD